MHGVRYKRNKGMIHIQAARHKFRKTVENHIIDVINPGSIYKEQWKCENTLVSSKFSLIFIDRDLEGFD